MSADQEDDNKVFHYESGVPVFDVAHRVDSVERENEQSKKREEQYKRDQLKLNTVLVLFTAILAVVGLGGIGVSIWQAIIANTSANAAKSAAETAKSTLDSTKTQFQLDERSRLGAPTFNVGPPVETFAYK